MSLVAASPREALCGYTPLPNFVHLVSFVVKKTFHPSL
jgi:hypothetical protein